MVGTVLAGIAGGILGALIILWWQRKAAKRRRSAHSPGQPVALPAAIRQEGQTRWRHGKLHLRTGQATWTPRLGRRGTVIFESAKEISVRLRPVGLRESLSISTALTVVALSFDGARLELALLADDLDLAREFLPLPKD